MEVFLVYLWLKLPLIIWGLSLAALVTAALFGLSVLTTKKEVPLDTFENWKESEQGKLKLKYTSYTERETWLHYCEKASIEKPLWTPPFKKFFLVPIGFLLLAGLTPNQTQTAVLVGTSIAVDVAKSPEGAKVGQLLRKKANELLDAELSKVTK